MRIGAVPEQFRNTFLPDAGNDSVFISLQVFDESSICGCINTTHDFIARVWPIFVPLIFR